MIFTQRFKELRRESRLSQLEIAEKLGLSQSAITKWETEKTEPTASAIVAVANFFHVTTDYLLGLENEDGTKVYEQDANIISTPIAPPAMWYQSIPGRSGNVQHIAVPHSEIEEIDKTLDAIYRKAQKEKTAPKKRAAEPPKRRDPKDTK